MKTNQYSGDSHCKERKLIMHIDYDELKLTDLIDSKVLQKIQDGFSDLTGMAALTTERDGTAVTTGSNFSDFCMKYTRCSELEWQRGNMPNWAKLRSGLRNYGKRDNICIPIHLI